MGNNDNGVRGWLRWKVPPIQAAKRESYVMSDKQDVGFIESQLTSKTNWLLAVAVIMAVLRQFGIEIDIGDIALPELPWIFAAAVATIAKAIKWIYYKIIRKSE